VSVLISCTIHRSHLTRDAFLVEHGLVRNCNQPTHLQRTVYPISNIFNYLDPPLVKHFGLIPQRRHLVCKRTQAESVITNEIETLRHNMSHDPIPSWANPPQIIGLKCFLCGAKPVVMNARI